MSDDTRQWPTVFYGTVAPNNIIELLGLDIWKKLKTN